MPSSKLIYLLLSLNILYAAAEKEWSWGSGSKKTESESQPKLDSSAEGSVSPNVVDEIITTGRDGRMLSGFNDVYQDQDVQDAIASGNDTHARSLVRERLCGLGLMSVSPHYLGLSTRREQSRLLMSIANLSTSFPHIRVILRLP